MENLELAFNGPPFFGVQIVSKQNATGTIRVYGLKDTTFIISAGRPKTYFFTGSILYNIGSDESKKCAIEVTSNNAEIEVFAIHGRRFFNEATRVLSLENLDKEYIVSCKKDDGGKGFSEFCVVATEDNTTLEITPTKLTRDGRAKNQKFTVTLTKGEVYQLQASADLSGSKIISNKKIAVFSGASTAFIYANNCIGNKADSHVYDQVPPTSLWDDEYLIAPNNYDKILPIGIITKNPNTKILINNVEFTTNDVGVLEVPITQNSYVKASENFLVVQFNRSFDCSSIKRGDPGSVFVSGLDGKITSSIFKAENIITAFALPDPNKLNFLIFDTLKTVVKVMVVASAIDRVFIDNKKINKNAFKPFTGNIDYYYGEFLLSQQIIDFDTFIGLDVLTGKADTQITLKPSILTSDTAVHSVFCDSGFIGTYTMLGSYDGIYLNLSAFGNRRIAPVDTVKPIVKKPFIQVFPIPSGKDIYIQFNPASTDFSPFDVDYLLYDEVGKLIVKDTKRITSSSKKITILGENLAPAIYYLKVQYGKSKLVYKVMKI